MDDELEKFNALSREEKIMITYSKIVNSLETGYIYGEPFVFGESTFYEFVVGAFQLGIQVSEHFRDQRQEEDEKRAEEIIKQLKSKLN